MIWTIKLGFIPLIFQAMLDVGVVAEIRADVTIGQKVDCNDFLFENAIVNHLFWFLYEIVFYLGFQFYVMRLMLPRKATFSHGKLQERHEDENQYGQHDDQASDSVSVDSVSNITERDKDYEQVHKHHNNFAQLDK